MKLRESTCWSLVSWGAVFIVAALLSIAPARSDTSLRVAKAVAYPFAYTPVDVGIATGAFQKEGLEIELSTFTGAPKMQQGLASDSVDIGIGGGTDMGFVAKGAPVLAIAATNVGPVPLVLLVTPSSPLKTVADLKGKTIGTSTPGSIIEWMPRELSRIEGWGRDGIKTASVGDIAAMLQAIKTNQLDGFVTDVTTGYRLEAAGEVRFFVHFSDYVKDLINGCIYARKELLKTNPDAARRFLAGWFDAVAYMRAHRDETIKIAQPIMNVSPEIAARTYDELIGAFSPDGRFPASGLKSMARMFVESGSLPQEPVMSDLYTEAYLPSAGK